MKYLSLLFCFLLFSCSKQIPFDKNKWNIKDDISNYVYRKEMIDDLLSRNIMFDKDISELETLFGSLEVEHEGKHNVIIQNIETDFGSDIDPISRLDLVIYLDKDSISTSAKLAEWKK